MVSAWVSEEKQQHFVRRGVDVFTLHDIDSQAPQCSGIPKWTCPAGRWMRVWAADDRGLRRDMRCHHLREGRLEPWHGGG